MLFSVWTPGGTNLLHKKGKNDQENLAVTFWSCKKDKYLESFVFSLKRNSVRLQIHPATTNHLIYKKGSSDHTGQKGSYGRKGLVKAFEMGEDMEGYVYLTDLCQVSWQLGWRRQQAPDWASAHRAFRAAWSCPHGSGCRCHDRQSNPQGMTPEVRGYGYLQQHDHDLAQYLLKIQ